MGSGETAAPRRGEEESGRRQRGGVGGDDGEVGSRETAAESEGRGSGKVEVEGEEHRRTTTSRAASDEERGQELRRGRGQGLRRRRRGEKREWGIGGESGGGKPTWGLCQNSFSSSVGKENALLLKSVAVARSSQTRYC